MEENAVVTGFKRLEMSVSSGGHYILYCQDPAEIRKKETAICTLEQFVCNFKAEDFISDPLDAEVRQCHRTTPKKAVSSSG